MAHTLRSGWLRGVGSLLPLSSGNQIQVFRFVWQELFIYQVILLAPKSDIFEH